LWFEQPLGNRFANNELLRRKLELQQTLMDQQQLLLTIVQEIAQALRDIETFQEEVEVTRAGTELARAPSLRPRRRSFAWALPPALTSWNSRKTSPLPARMKPGRSATITSPWQDWTS
jgi:hypothetical protein